VRVHLAGEHAAELESLGALLQQVEVGDDRFGRTCVLLGDREVEQLARFVQRAGQGSERFDDLRQSRAFLAQLLCALRIVPDFRVLELARYFFEPFLLGIEVKDTP